MGLFDEPQTCPNCNGSGTVTITEGRMRAYLDGIWRRESLEKATNAEMAKYLGEVQNYLRNRDLSPLVLETLDEIWWRLHAADEPAGETRRKIEALRDDPEWLEKD